MRMMTLVLALLGTALAGGCVSKEGPGDAGNRAVRFFLESSDGEGLAAVLPKSGVSLRLNPKPVITEVDLAGADEAQVELGRCLLLHLTPAAGRDLYRLTVAHQGRRLALELDGVVIGARRIDGPIADGRIFIFVELSDEALPGLVQELRATAAAIRRKVGDRR